MNETTDQQLKHISKFLSLVLRHQPQMIGLTPDTNGWCNTDELITKSNAYGVRFDIDTLKHIVETNDKKRFAFCDNLEKIRASQGHSIEVDLEFHNQEPPEILYHGTAEINRSSIMQAGIEKRNRRHVHLSKDPATAIQVGQRHGKPYIFKVKALDMHHDKYEFYLSANGVWLTDFVPAQYLLID
ncbi:RNA 2'-phosphotransferase [Polluticaenibacter yanchengensis]|uniref:Probable RNA 2'-phosphotransferase n=1 Tax=Polluticaenibacter yanchengensis TaxID=3014562 RepID=A0ABT4UHF5_9BACT|nr:RNA 2'-phosphotransferase [Chitinophagaceae bacterium LY-5]